MKMYKTIILPVVLYGCETLCLTLREVHRLRVTENRVLRRIFRLKRGQVSGDWRKVHNEEEFRNFHSSSNIIKVVKSRKIRWAKYLARMEDTRNAYSISVGKPEGKRPLGIHRHMRR
jgi:hypothetical protein